MTFRIPFTFSDIEILKRRSKYFLKFAKNKKEKLENYLKGSAGKVDSRQYMAICYRAFVLDVLGFSVLFTSLLGVMRINFFFVYGLIAAFLVSIMILFNQMNYPRIFALNKERNIEKNLISVLQDMTVQLNSGVPLFRILVNISESDYGEVSVEFAKIAKEMNSGVSQIEALEKYGKLNTSKYFQRILWQLSNGMRSGSDMAIVIDEAIKNLTEEQEIQIQNYGGKLNPMIMFYMLIAVILPSLGITFLIILSSMLNLEKTLVYLMFFGIFGFVVFMQIMFLGIIKSKRPSLL
jgi:flagellar protein FlaJ